MHLEESDVARNVSNVFVKHCSHLYNKHTLTQHTPHTCVHKPHRYHDWIQFLDQLTEVCKLILFSIHLRTTRKKMRSLKNRTLNWLSHFVPRYSNVIFPMEPNQRSRAINGLMNRTFPPKQQRHQNHCNTKCNLNQPNSKQK